MPGSRFLLPTAASIALAACAAKQPPAIAYDPAAFKPAIEKHDSAPKKIAITQAMPLQHIAIPAANETPNLPSPTTRVKAANRKALHEPTSDNYLDAIQIYPFENDALYRLYAAPQQVTDIVLQTGETLTAISAGDTVRWAVGNTTSGSGTDEHVHVLVKPFTAGLQTNLVILTNRRTYHLELQSTKQTAMAAISWTYPQDDLVTQIGNTRRTAESIIDTGVAVDTLHFHYAISGDHPPWRPVRAFDDGHKVYIEFPARLDQGDAPPLFVVGADGGSDLVNYRVRGNYYIVDRLFAAAELRLGGKDQQVVRISRSDTPPALVEPSPGG